MQSYLDLRGATAVQSHGVLSALGVCRRRPLNPEQTGGDAEKVIAMCRASRTCACNSYPGYPGAGQGSANLTLEKACLSNK